METKLTECWNCGSEHLVQIRHNKVQCGECNEVYTVEFKADGMHVVPDVADSD